MSNPRTVVEAPIDSFSSSDQSTNASLDSSDGMIVIVEAMDEWIIGRLN